MTIISDCLIVFATVIVGVKGAPRVLMLDVGTIGNRSSNAQVYTPVQTALGDLKVELQSEFPPEGAVVENVAYFLCGKQLYIHDPTTNTTSLGTQLLRERQFFTATAMGTDIFVCGGYYPKWDIYLRTCEVYNTLTNTWSYEVKRMARGRGHHAAVAVKDRLYLFGGQKGLSNTLAIYDSRVNKWFRGAKMLYATQNHAAVNLGAHIFTCGGARTAECSGYNIRTNKWYRMAPLAKPRVFHEMLVWNGSPLVLGGLWDGEGTKLVEYYDWIHNRTLLLHQELAEPVSEFAAVLVF